MVGTKIKAKGSLDPGNPLIVSTAPFVSISFELMGTFRCNTKNNLVLGERMKKEGTEKG
jgi:hypothetical protein